ncbi:MAG: glycosyltransferase [Burkholderiaceae bacterium]|nr:glycosyltransferase [Microbacteriaceae bacterium]
MIVTVSVALCTFNGEAHLAGQLASILAQHTLPDEVVISDDGSTDGTLAVISTWSEKADAAGIATRVLTRETPVGVTANFASAIAACRCDVVVLCDQDDLWHRGRVSVAVDAFNADPALLLQHGDARLVDAGGDPLGTTLFAALGVTADDRAAINAGRGFARYLRRNLATGATLAFRRTLFDTAAPLPAEWVHDEWLAIVAAATGAVAVTDEVLIDYRQHDSNQIGVAAATLAYRVKRMLGSPVDRNHLLARRAAILAARLPQIAGVTAATATSARNKARFEESRAALPQLRVARIPGILQAARGGAYVRFASQGRLDMVRDLFGRRAAR